MMIGTLLVWRPFLWSSLSTFEQSVRSGLVLKRLFIVGRKSKYKLRKSAFLNLLEIRFDDCLKCLSCSNSIFEFLRPINPSNFWPKSRLPQFFALASRQFFRGAFAYHRKTHSVLQFCYCIHFLKFCILKFRNQANLWNSQFWKHHFLGLKLEIQLSVKNY